MAKSEKQGTMEVDMEVALMEVCPTEDAIKSFMDYFLQPLLPAKSTKKHVPTSEQEEAVAKQVHAVVMLYNYYHRRQHPHLEFLDFESFLQLMTIQKPPFLAYLKYLQLPTGNEPRNMDMESRMSVTEKIVMDACDVCMTLDVAKGVPSLEGWPICKVAVLLVDAKKENCILQFSSITKGAWSLIEKDVDPIISFDRGFEGPSQVKGVYFRKRAIKKSTSADDNVQLQKLAISAIVDATGIKKENLRILESHLLHSLHKVKAAVRFFIVKCIKSFSDDFTPIPIQFVVDSLQRPVLKKDGISWSVTDAVEYFHLLPYVALMSAWLSRDDSSDELVAEMEASNEDDSRYSLLISPNKDVKGVEVSQNGISEEPYQKTSQAYLLPNGATSCAKSKENPKSTSSSLSVKAEVIGTKDRVYPHEHDVVIRNNCNSNGAAGNGNILLQTALKVLLGKRGKLAQQRRDIEDEIAQCDESIQSVLCGGEDVLAMKLESLVDACTDMSLKSTVGSLNAVAALYNGEGSHIPAKRRRSDEPITDLQSPSKVDSWA